MSAPGMGDSPLASARVVTTTRCFRLGASRTSGAPAGAGSGTGASSAGPPPTGSPIPRPGEFLPGEPAEERAIHLVVRLAQDLRHDRPPLGGAHEIPHRR